MDDEAAAPTPAEQTKGPDWAEQRRQAVAGHAAALDADRAAEARQAGQLLADFVRRAAGRGLEPHPLQARGFDGRATFRTSIRGWYLKSNRTVAVGADAAYYVLTVPGTLRDRLFGAALTPSTPRLIVGAGGGDGETVPLATLLDRRLEAGARWP